MAGGGLNGQQGSGVQPSMEPLAMLQAYRAGRPVVNPTYQRQQQYLPEQLPQYTYVPPAPAIAESLVQPQQMAWYGPVSAAESAGPGTDGSPADAGNSMGFAGGGGFGDASGMEGGFGEGGGGGGGSK